MHYSEMSREQLIRLVEIARDYIKALENGDFPLEEARRLNGIDINLSRIPEDWRWGKI